MLLCLGSDPDLRLREIAHRAGITPRAVQLILRDLEQEGYITSTRVGRRNRYEVHVDRPLRHPLVAHREVRGLLALLDAQPPEAEEAVPPPAGGAGA